MASIVAVDELCAYAISTDADAFAAAVEAAAGDPTALAAAVATYLDPVYGGHWGTLPSQQA